MILYAGIGAALFASIVFSAWAGLPGFALVLVPIPVAVYALRHRTSWALGLAAGAVFASTVFMPVSVVVMRYALVAGAAVVFGVALRRRWSFGACVAILMVLCFGPILVDIIGHWESYISLSNVFLTARLADFEAAARNGTNLEQASENLRWLAENWRYLSLGALGSMALLAITAGMIAFSRWLRWLHFACGPTDGFRNMRPPEALVWLVIVLALLGMAEQRWENEAIRLFTWNSGVLLSALYWLNALSIVVFALRILEAATPLFVACVASALLLGTSQWGSPVLCTVGFFDTWWDFRARFRRLAALRHASEEGEDSN